MSSGKDASEVEAQIKDLMSSAQGNGIDTSVLLNDLIDCFGGPSKLARAMHAEFIAAKSGSMVRTRTLEMIQRLVMANTQYELSNLKKPADMDDEEIEAEISRLITRKSQLNDKA